MESLKGGKVTVQGVMTPVPAVLGSVQAGSRPSLSNDRNAIPVDRLAGVADRATSRNNSEDRNAADVFRRSNKLSRSPPATPSGTLRHTILHARAAEGDLLLDTPSVRGPSKVIPEEPTSGGIDASNLRPGSEVPKEVDEMIVPETVVTATMKEGSPRQELINKMRKMEEEAIHQCKVTLIGMQGAINRQRNISNEVKTGISKMAELLDVMMSYRRTWKAAEGERTFSNLGKNIVSRQLVDAPTPKSTNPKRPATSPNVSASSKRVKSKTPSVEGSATGGNGDGNWQLVTRKVGNTRRARKEVSKVGKSIGPSSRPIKSEAVMVRPTEGHSYAEVLKSLRSKLVADV